MKVRIYKAPDGKGKLIKAKNGMAVNVDKEIKKKIAEGKDPEIIIYEMAEFGLSRPEAKSKVNKYYDLLGDDEYDEDEVSAPYDTPVQDEVEKVVEEEEPDNAAIYDYYGGDNQGLDVVNDGIDYDDEEASYGGQYAEGGQFAPGSIIPTPKKPYYIGIDAEPYDNAYKFGGLTKSGYIKRRVKELRKAALGDQVENTETNISPRGTIDSPAGFVTPEKGLASIIKQTGNEAMMKQQAENEYQQYQNSTMGQDFNGKFLFGGRNRKIARANRALFGTPIALPGVDVNYQFGPLGGLRSAEAKWDLDAIGDLAKFLPGAMGMFPGIMGGFNPAMMSYKKVSYPAQIRKKVISEINNQADPSKNNESVKLNNNPIKPYPGYVELNPAPAGTEMVYDAMGNEVEAISPDEAARRKANSNTQSPLLSGSFKPIDLFANKRKPIVGERWDDWYTSDGSTPGIAPDNRIWDGKQWVGPGPLDNREHGGFVNTETMDPNMLAKFIYGGDEYAYGGDVIPKAAPGMMVGNTQNPLAVQNYIANHLKYHNYGQNKINKTPQQTQQPAPQTVNPFMQYMQMMQGQQGMGYGNPYAQMMGNPFMGNAFGNQQFWTGRPQRLGFGLTRDFNYTNAYSPVNWQVPEGTKKITEKVYKDRGKWYNPFDTETVREWYADGAEDGSDDLINKQGSGTNINTGTDWDKSELDTRRERRQAKAHDELISSGGKMVDNEDLPTSMETLPPTQMTTSASTQMPDQLQSQEVGNMKTLPPQQMGVPGLQSNTIQTSENPSGTEYNTLYPSGTSSSSGISSVYEPETTTTNSYVMPPSSNQFGTSGFGNPFGNMKNPTGAPTNQFGIIRREYGGYVPDYMAYGGYMPEAKPGIIVDKEEFTDPNLIGRTVEQSAYKFRGPEFVTGAIGTTRGLTNILNEISDKKNIVNPQMVQERTRDAGTANTDQSGFVSAERAGSDLMARGTYTQYGTTPGQQGYEGGLYGKKGGQMNSQYAKGKVYSLTMEQIKAIEAAGGKVEYIK